MNPQKKYTLQDLIDQANKNNGKCISKKFESVKSKYLWKCENNHTWEASFNNILYNKTWCPFCSKKKRLSIKDMQNLAAKHGGKCLSNKYSNRSTKLQWQCKRGHIWEATANNIEHRNSWCEKCNRQKYIEVQYKKLKELCQINQIRIHNSNYETVNTKMKFKCPNGHIWTSTPKQLKKGFLCPVCHLAN